MKNFSILLSSLCFWPDALRLPCRKARCLVPLRPLQSRQRPPKRTQLRYLAPHRRRKNTTLLRNPSNR